MSSARRDLEFITALAEGFFGQRVIRRTLRVIGEQEISGWEKWLQVEFAAYIHDHEEVKAWGRETPYLTDRRVERAREKCAIDFIIHQKYKQSHLALELKQVDSVGRCARAMVTDIKKMFAIRKAEFDIRSVWCLGVHARASEPEVLRKLIYHADELGLDLDHKLVATRHIGQTGYAFSII
jgi:hypothetical protein